MTDDERATYALAQRENCRPMECSLDAACWVTQGGREALEQRSISATPRCQACGGKVLLEQWRTPGSMGLSAHGRLSYRGRARSQGPVAKKREGDSPANPWGANSSPASGGA